MTFRSDANTYVPSAIDKWTQETERLLDQVGQSVSDVENRGLHPALLCSGQLRPVLRRLLQSSRAGRCRDSVRRNRQICATWVPVVI